MITQRLVIHGRVQGVGYRASMVAAANRMGVAGWVRNRREGTVEALIQGDAASVDSLINWARQGPSGAVVEQLEVLEATECDNYYTHFTQQSTV